MSASRRLPPELTHADRLAREAARLRNSLTTPGTGALRGLSCEEYAPFWIARSYVEGAIVRAAAYLELEAERARRPKLRLVRGGAA